ncbi:AraC family transcriptional regulator [Nonomuraea deserti]|uniref:AraC family transcriptional regulator n=1 Tax=Nonomuraea deserti TaxID=1848322 RepID=A0A4R4V7G6_9ACTN|nr:helix-turn-helix transcriptional regulator [Nonomuraea deserti]TDD00631.1 AraC family transcriptional regulator [Nonomuraea deserti]
MADDGEMEGEVSRSRVMTRRGRLAGGRVNRAITVTGGGHLRSDAHVLDLGVAVLEVRRFHPLTVQRQAYRPHTAHEDAIHLIAPMYGTVNTTSAGLRSTVTAGELYAYDLAGHEELTLRPDGCDDLKLALLAIPKPVLPLRDDAIAVLLGRGMPVDGGLSGLLRQFIEDLSDEKLSLSPGDGPRLGMVLVDLVTACFSSLLESGRGSQPGSQRQALGLRLRTYVQNQLHDPELCPQSIAAAHHISISYLHRLFQEQGYTVSGWIREQRLRRTIRDLADAALADVPIHEIGARWGFSRPSDFSRTFRAAFGVSPRQFRSEQLAEPFRAALLPDFRYRHLTRGTE